MQVASGAGQMCRHASNIWEWEAIVVNNHLLPLYWFCLLPHPQQSPDSERSQNKGFVTWDQTSDPSSSVSCPLSLAESWHLSKRQKVGQPLRRANNIVRCKWDENIPADPRPACPKAADLMKQVSRWGHSPNSRHVLPTPAWRVPLHFSVRFIDPSESHF